MSSSGNARKTNFSTSATTFQAIAAIREEIDALERSTRSLEEKNAAIAKELVLPADVLAQTDVLVDERSRKVVSAKDELAESEERNREDQADYDGCLLTMEDLSGRITDRRKQRMRGQEEFFDQFSGEVKRSVRMGGLYPKGPDSSWEVMKSENERSIAEMEERRKGQEERRKTLEKEGEVERQSLERKGQLAKSLREKVKSVVKENEERTKRIFYLRQGANNSGRNKE